MTGILFKEENYHLKNILSPRTEKYYKKCP
jgi:hypothetical protein